MLRFKDYEYTIFDDKSGVATATYRLGRDIFIDYKDKTKENIPEIIISMMREVYAEVTINKVLSTAFIMFDASYYLDGSSKELKYKFLSTPQTYKEVFNVKETKSF